VNTTIEISCVVTRKVTVVVCATDEVVQISTDDGITVIGWDDIPALIEAIHVIQKKHKRMGASHGK
jgi:hypothetical protein